MIIFSFDCAVKTLAFCCIKYDENYLDKLNINITQLKNINKSLLEHKLEHKLDHKLLEINKLLTDIQINIDKRIELIYINVFFF